MPEWPLSGGGFNANKVNIKFRKSLNKNTFMYIIVVTAYIFFF